MSVCPRSLLLALLIILYLQSCTVGQHGKAPKECCFSFYTRPIPVAFISKYEEMRANCTRPGVILTTKKGVRVCVNPSLKWVQQLMYTIDHGVLEDSGELHEHEVKTKTRPVSGTSRPDPATDAQNHEHETQSRPVPETLRPDSNEPKLFCLI
ncbi:C-C motif chemokine 18-like [Colossoma macropomum]|uniref:C-C motif chemokine 18-like n=1 Tax=Colossoma macropomum TaxID=42526 RepID=UPI001863D209|nr:C-C motif chemokine 18-like [Colossoma macropomum]